MASGVDKASGSSYTIVRIPRNEESIREYLEPYKSFRLLSLQLEPDAFFSTYAREVAFTDDMWRGRLANPMASTFVAVNRDTGELLSMATTVGPLPFGPQELPLDNPWTSIEDQSDTTGVTSVNPQHFRLNAIFTLPAARRQGISKSLIKTAIQRTRDSVLSVGNSGIIVSVVLEGENSQARALYEKCGFALVKTVDKPSDSSMKLLLLEYGA